VVEGSEAILPMKKHSLYAPYVESNLQNKYWDFGGDAIVDTNRHIRLTQDKPHQAGYLWSRTPIANDNYEVEFEFRIDGKAGVTFGDGLAVWLTDDRAEPGPVFGNKDKFRGLGVFFDTYANARHVSTRKDGDIKVKLSG
jgi:mannose-binding lectin 2